MRRAVVTGASSGIGRAIALGLARAGFYVDAVGRDRDRLAEILLAAGDELLAAHAVDLLDDTKLQAFAADIVAAGGLDVLVHAAGIHRQRALAESSAADFDAVVRTNLRVPHELTRLLLPALIGASGEVVLVNSSVGLRSGPGIAAYGASKHGLRALADSLRDEVNGRGVRVLTLYVGRTATPMQAGIVTAEGGTWEPDRLIQPADVAAMVLASISLPRTAEVTEISIRPMLPPRPAG
jgi:NADP-dependent 3-hydroxy acid dehydrogenase YdfG